MPEHPDLTRLREEYADRERRLAGSDAYSYFSSSNLFTYQQRQWDTVSLLKKAGISSLRNMKLLEIGCGSGGVLLEYLSYGASPSFLFGVDLLGYRVIDAHQRFPLLPLACADGQDLPYACHAFDLILQYTAFSSILDMQVKKKIAGEMIRVLRPQGLILWYDFWLNPQNPQTRGILPAEVRTLFPGCACQFRRVTLAPPIARRLVPFSKMLAILLEKMRVFNSHYLFTIQRKFP